MIIYTIVLQIDINTNQRTCYINYDPNCTIPKFDFGSFPLYDENDASNRVNQDIYDQFVNGQTILQTFSKLKALIDSFPYDYQQKMDQIEKIITDFGEFKSDKKLNRIDAEVNKIIGDCSYMKDQYQQLKAIQIKKVKTINAQRMKQTVDEVFREQKITKEEYDLIVEYIEDYLSNQLDF